MKRYYRTNPPGPNGPPTSTSLPRPEGLTRFAALPVPRHIVRKIESLWLPGDQMVHLRLEWLRPVEGADHNVDLAWQPLVLVQERRPAIATEGSADAMGRPVDLRSSLLRLHLLRTVPGEG